VKLPDDLSYTTDHEWIAIAPGAGTPAGEVRIGLSAVAVEALGEIVFVELPEPGTELTAGEPCGEVESTKSVSELFSPATGTVVTVNTALADNPALVGEDPYGEGWLFTATVSELGAVLDAAEYRAKNEG
jgi:glycine cleavage system H protein